MSSVHSYSSIIEQITATKVFFLRFHDKLHYYFSELRRRTKNIEDLKKAKQKLRITKSNIAEQRKKVIIKVFTVCCRNKAKAEFNKWRTQIFLKKMFFKAHSQIENEIPRHLIEKQNQTKDVAALQNGSMTFIFVKNMINKLGNEYAEKQIMTFYENIKKKSRPDHLNDQLNKKLMEMINEFLKTLTNGV